MKMFAKFVPFMLVTAMSVFTACGGDSGSNADSEEPVSSSAVKKIQQQQGEVKLFNKKFLLKHKIFFVCENILKCEQR